MSIVTKFTPRTEREDFLVRAITTATDAHEKLKLQRELAGYVIKAAQEQRALRRLTDAAPEMAAALLEAEKELRLLNVARDGSQQQNTPAAGVLRTVRAALDQAGL